jgi:hypothetical protein
LSLRATGCWTRGNRWPGPAGSLPAGSHRAARGGGEGELEKRESSGEGTRGENGRNPRGRDGGRETERWGAVEGREGERRREKGAKGGT